jgi:hypothetical protein
MKLFLTKGVMRGLHAPAKLPRATYGLKEYP